MAICRLPPELLQRTFFHYLEDATDEEQCRHPTSRLVRIHDIPGDMVLETRSQCDRSRFCTPFHLSLVCRQWYSLVTGEPRLWRSIHFHGPQPRDVSIFRRWLQRSGNELLTLSLHEDINGVGRVAEVTRQVGHFKQAPLSRRKLALFDILELAIGVSERWRAISLSLGDDVGRVFQTEDFEEGRFPNLEAFEIDVRDTGATLWADPSAQTPTPLHALSQRLCSSPRLASARWTSHIDDKIRQYVPFERLISLSLGRVSDSEATLLLSRCQGLRQLEIRNYGTPRPHAMEDNAYIALPKLQVVSLGFLDDFPFVPPFFRIALTPSLQELHLERGFGRSTTRLRVIECSRLGIGDEKGWRGLVEFLERSGCILRKLTYCPDVQLSAIEERVMMEYLKDRVFAGLIEQPRRWWSRREISRWDGIGTSGD